MQRRDIIHPVDDRHILVEIEVFTQLFKSGVQVSDMRDRIDNGLTIQCQDQSQRGMRRRMLWPKVERPEIFLVRSIQFCEIGNFKRHDRLLDGDK